MVPVIAGLLLLGQLPPLEARRFTIGWSDEMDGLSSWRPLGVQNQAKLDARAGSYTLRLGQVPTGWPYAYQWSGVTQDVVANIRRFPVIMARVSELHGYAHLDVEVLDARNRPIRTFRSSTLTSPGLCELDLQRFLDPAIYTLRIRMIVGGPNAGCDATYKWLRLVSVADTPYFRSHQDYELTAWDRREPSGRD